MYKLATILLASLYFTHALTSDDITQALRTELGSVKTGILSQETFPIFYRLIERLSGAAAIPIPQYISVYEAEYQKVTKEGFIEKHRRDVQAYLDLFGDLVIAREIISEASYHELEGILAIAFGEKMLNRLSQQTASGLAAFAATLATTFGLNTISHVMPKAVSDNLVAGGIQASFFATWLTYAATGRSIQKSAVAKALPLTNPMYIRDGLNALARIHNKNNNPSFVERAFSFLHLKYILDPIIQAFSLNNTPATLLEELGTHIELCDVCD